IRHNYILKEFGINLFFSFAIFAFMFSMRAMLKVFELFIKGTFSPVLVSMFFFLTFITTFTHIIPLAFLYSSMAVFARMSMDRELLIFTSSGIASSKLMRPIFLIAIAGTFFLVIFNLYLMPEASNRQRELVQTLKFRNPLSLIQEKNIISDIPGITLYMGKVNRNFEMENIAITQKEKDRINFLMAEKGNLKYDGKKNIFIFNLEDGYIVSQYSKESISNLNFKYYTFAFSLPSHFKQNMIKTRISDMHFSQLLSGWEFEEQLELNKRLVFAVTPLFFIFLGAGLGRRVRQKSKILHIGLGGIIGILFFQIVFIGEIFARKAGFPPLIWLSILISGAAAFSLLERKC
ncbi:MAG TPA: LptF/LptG family permease, partial [bacterium]|nr:LptF/LptG family permease [bacterium]